MTFADTIAPHFNQSASQAPVQPKPQPRLQDICPCYRPKF